MKREKSSLFFIVYLLPHLLHDFLQLDFIQTGFFSHSPMPDQNLQWRLPSEQESGAAGGERKHIK